MIEQSVKVNLEVGLHARPAAIFVQKTNRFLSDIHLEKEGRKIDAKSIIGVMSLGVAHGEIVKLIINGEDEEEAMKELRRFLESNLGDD